jgi:hypothetical protein
VPHRVSQGLDPSDPRSGRRECNYNTKGRGLEPPALSLITTTILCILEGESTREHHRSTGDGGYCDLCDAWIRNPGGQSGWIEGVLGIFEAGMVKDVLRIHPKLHFASLPSRYTPALGQREVEIR